MLVFCVLERNIFGGLFQSYIIPAILFPRTTLVKDKQWTEFGVPVISNLTCGVTLFYARTCLILRYFRSRTPLMFLCQHQWFFYGWIDHAYIMSCCTLERAENCPWWFSPSADSAEPRGRSLPPPPPSGGFGAESGEKGKTHELR